MSEFKLNKATLSDRLYFSSEDVIGGTIDALNSALFTYDLGESIITVMEYHEDTNLYSVPSGSWYKLPIINLIDNRPRFDRINNEFLGTLREDQLNIVNALFNGDKLYSGLIQAGCGFGKSFVGGFITNKYGKPTIIICHTVLLANQWLNLLKKLMPNTKIGLVGNSIEDIQDITVGIYKSVSNRLDKLKDKFELMIVDEAHKCPAATFSKVVNSMNVRVKIALSATPTRKDGMHIVLQDYFGPNKLIAKDSGKLTPAVEILQTKIPFPVRNPKFEWSKQVTKLAQREDYVNLIVEKAKEKISEGRCLLILSERIELLTSIQPLLPKSKLLIGETKGRDEILSNVGIEVDAILSTKIFDEGISCHRLDTLFLTCPSNNPGLLEQRIGRILREHEDKLSPLIVDFWLNGPIVFQQQRKRQQWYAQKRYNLLPTQNL